MISDRMKQRLVGASVLIALAVIFIPVLFNLQPSRPLDQTTQIPHAPEISPVEFEEPIQPQIDNDVLPHEEVFALTGEDVDAPPMPVSEAIGAGEELEIRELPMQSAEEVRAAPNEEPGLSESGLPAAWIIQVASYGKKDTAKILTEKLQKAGFKAYSEQANVNGRQVFRVFVGPFVSRESAQDDKKLVDSAVGVESIIFSFEP